MSIANFSYRASNKVFGKNGKNAFLQTLSKASLKYYKAEKSAYTRMAEFVEGVCQLRPHRRMHDMQSDRWYYPDLSAVPYPDTSKFNWIPMLESRWQDIRNEYLSLEKYGILHGHQNAYHTEKGQWDTFYLTSVGYPLPEIDKICPITCQLLSEIPETHGAGPAYFSIMRPGTKVAPHYGPFNYRLRCHLGLSIPNNCGIDVADERREWQEGRCLVLDDSILHSVWNDSSENRAVLLFDFWHPELSLAERKTLELIDSVTATRKYYIETVRKNQKESVNAFFSAKRKSSRHNLLETS
ncbi:aspartyl/asparaginyl beta-hydroxylase domain-containing protein [Biformimicrobium ophioploci]|uniref:Aspartyl/asparaginy/proline hydroxylase domain-containing protein n=1 Tax=Biformimicrobium ophioploci TaxID=3036711 RepID=A0ABQ6LXG7_9GAMM|nr:aspartyl/asparaginyl beta-hydroxylase domain-containing protein [Microbulbifer sp. NKW57]GMG86814.1 hypothetical protein MNKW57_11350 [Microbulbifer sp. NKW57]